MRERLWLAALVTAAGCEFSFTPDPAPHICTEGATRCRGGDGLSELCVGGTRWQVEYCNWNAEGDERLNCPEVNKGGYCLRSRCYCGAPLTPAPGVGSWRATGSLLSARSGHTATLLPSGRVLAAGGDGPEGLLSSAELYHPDTSQWVAAASMHEARSRHLAVLLASGKVFVIGGGGSAAAEVYDPAADTWEVVAAPPAPFPSTATILPTGRVLVVFEADAQLYDPDTDEWVPTAAPGMYADSATSIPAGGVLLVSGSVAMLYDESSGEWIRTGDLPQASFEHVAVATSAGQVMVVGGMEASSPPALYEPDAGAWTLTGPLEHFHTRSHSASALPSGSVLVVGGDEDSVLTRAHPELYDPGSNAWRFAATLTGRHSHTATVLPSGEVLVAGGFGVLGSAGGFATLADVEIFSPPAP